MNCSLNTNCKLSKMSYEFPFYSAITIGDFELVKLMVMEGVDINMRNFFGDTPLLHACFKNNYRIVKYFLDIDNSTVNEPDIGGYTPLFVASSKGNFGIVKLLLKNGADVNYKEYYGRTPLFEAVYYASTRRIRSYFKIVRILLDNPFGKNADPNISTTNRFSPVVHSVQNEELMKLMIDHKADLSCLIECMGIIDNLNVALMVIQIMDIEDLYKSMENCQNYRNVRLIKNRISQMWMPFLLAFNKKGFSEDIGRNIKSFLV